MALGLEMKNYVPVALQLWWRCNYSEYGITKIQVFLVRPDNMPRSTHKCLNIYYPSWASEASPTLECSIEISRDIYIYVVGMSRMSN